MKGIEIPIVEVKKGSDIQPPLEKTVAEFLDSILDGARSCFENDGECKPLFFAMKDGEVIPHIIGELNPDIKPALFNWMHRQVPLYDACIFVVETWFARAMKNEDPHQLLVMPSERFDKREMVMVHLWLKDRSVAIVAESERNPDRLGPWEKFSDSADTGSLKFEGQMVRTPEKGQS